MAGTIQLKRSTTAGNVPSSLTAGEVAINHPDRKLYVNDGVGTIRGVDLTADVEKPVSTAQAASIATRLAAASNLSDLSAPATARQNIGINDTSGRVVGASDVMTCTLTATGAVSRSHQARWGDFTNVKDLGAKGDGSTDDSAAFQQAFNNGGAVYVPAGIYVILSTLSITKQILVFGSGQGPSVILGNNPTADVIQITGPAPNSGFGGAPNIEFERLCFDTNVTRTNGSYIVTTNGVYNVRVNHCRFNRAFCGVRNTGAGGDGFHVRNCEFWYTSYISIIIENSSPIPVDILLENIKIRGSGPSNQSGAGVKISAAGDALLKNVQTVWAGRGLWVCPTSGVRIQSMRVVDSTFDSGADWNIYIATNGGPINEITLQDVLGFTTANGYTGGSCYLGTNSSGAIQQATLINVNGSNTTMQGFRVSNNVTNLKMIGCSASNNGSHGLQIDGGTTDFTVTDCRFGPTGEFLNGNAGNGIIVMPGASDRFIITNNRTYGNTGTNIVTSGVTGTNTVVTNNI